MLNYGHEAGRVACHVTVIPVSDGQADVCARLENGDEIRGEWQIIRRRPRAKIARLFHKPRLAAHPAACRALRDAQLIIIAPGSLRTGIISVLLAEGIRKTIRRSRAPILYVSNIMTQPGQTDGFSLTDHVAELAKHLGRVPALVVANCGRPAASVLHEYHAAGSEIVRLPADKGRPRRVRVSFGDNHNVQAQPFLLPPRLRGGLGRGSRGHPETPLCPPASGGKATCKRDVHPPRTGAWRLCWSVERTGGSPGKEAETIVLAADLVHRASLRGILRLDRASGAGMPAGPHLIRHNAEKLAAAIAGTCGL